MNRYYLVLLVTFCGVIVIAKTPAALDSFEIFDFIKDEDLPRPIKKVDWLDAFDTYMVEKSTAEQDITVLEARLAMLESLIDKELRVLRTTMSAIAQIVARNESLAPGQHRLVELVREREEVLNEIQGPQWKARNAQITIEWNKPLIEASCRRRIAELQDKANEIIKNRRDKATRPMERSKILRDIATKAIERFSIDPPKIGLADLSESQRSQLHNTVSWHLENEVKDEAEELPRISRRKLQEKGWSFLHNWIALLDSITAADYKKEVLQHMATLNEEYANLRKDFAHAQSVFA